MPERDEGVAPLPHSPIQSVGRSPATARSAIELTAETQPTVRLLFVEHRARTYVIPSDPSSAWFAAAVRERSCRVRWPDGRESLSTSSIVEDPGLRGRLQELFQSKYGAKVWMTYFEGRTEVLEIDPNRLPPPPTAAERIRGEFDAVSSSYDASIARQPIERYLKDRVIALSLDSLRALDPILEVGPGTGYHTLPLLAAGHRVVAVDISERMLEQVRRRADRAEMGDRLVTRTARFGELGSALVDLREGYFGAVFSAFGAFNLEPDLAPAALALSRLIRPGGRLVFTTLNRPGLVPLLWELALGRPAAAGFRVGGVVPPAGLRYPLELYLRSPVDWDRALSNGFVRQSARPVSVLAPPFDSDRAVRFLRTRGSERVRRWDAFLASRPFSWLTAEWVFLSYDRKDPRPRRG